LREIDSLENTLQLRCQSEADCEQKLKNLVEQHKIAEKSVREFPQKAATLTLFNGGK
jgi:hypothetical protein